MYKALYRKYRPNDFNEVYGQDVVKKTIINEINNNKISHAYLFCGPRGTGKTSVAKLIAKLINCTNVKNGVACNKCESCEQINNNSNLDIVEIDAASNNGVDEIRELKDKVKFMPTISKYKVYIIDEVHMLSTGAFNALLKTLEEPPQHVVFILATTEVQKIPVTIISRCQRFDFKKISSTKIYERLKYIVDTEKIKINDDALKEISNLTDGGLRDAIGLLDKLISYTDDEITTDIVHTVNYTVTKNDLDNIIKCINDNDVERYISIINELDEQGKDLNKFVDELIIRLRDILIEKEEKINITEEKIIEYISYFNDLSAKIKNSNYPKILIETAIFILNKNNSNKILTVEKSEAKKEIKKENKKETKEVVEPKMEEQIEEVEINSFDDLKKIRISNTFSKANKKYLNNIKSKWNKIHDFSIDNVYGIAAGMLIDSEVVLASDSNVIVTFPYESMAQRANDIVYLIEYVLEHSFDNKYNFLAVSTDEWEKLKKEYIKNIKNGVQYKYVKEIVSYDKILNQENSIVNESIELFGSDVLQII